MDFLTERGEVSCSQQDCTFYNPEAEQNCEGIGAKCGDPAPAFCNSYIPEYYLEKK